MADVAGLALRVGRTYHSPLVAVMQAARRA